MHFSVSGVKYCAPIPCVLYVEMFITSMNVFSSKWKYTINFTVSAMKMSIAPLLINDQDLEMQIPDFNLWAQAGSLNVSVRNSLFK